MAKKLDAQLARAALARLRGVKADTVRHILECGLTAQDFFAMPREELAEALDMRREAVWTDGARDSAVREAQHMLDGMSRYRDMHMLCLGEPDYPQPLAMTADAPVALYVLGSRDLSSAHTLSVVGTRKAGPYGLDFTRKLVTELGAQFRDLIVFSGLAYGIDTAAHTAALKAGVRTVAVVAHGLHMIYPNDNRNLAASMVRAGGAVVSEYPLDTPPHQRQFLERNRIIAGLSQVTVVAESDVRGGAMTTARHAASYHREVMALPGRVTDTLSSGCNQLIRRGRAQLIERPSDLVQATGWIHGLPEGETTQDGNLFPELEGEVAIIYKALSHAGEALTVDQLCVRTGLSASRLLAHLAEMEFDGLAARHSGGRYTAL